MSSIISNLPKSGSVSDANTALNGKALHHQDQMRLVTNYNSSYINIGKQPISLKLIFSSVNLSVSDRILLTCLFYCLVKKEFLRPSVQEHVRYFTSKTVFNHKNNITCYLFIFKSLIELSCSTVNRTQDLRHVGKCSNIEPSPQSHNFIF